MSNSTNTDKPTVVPVTTLLEKLTSGEWVYYISEQSPKDTDKSTQYQGLIVYSNTKKEIFDGNYVIKAFAKIKNGPFMDKGQKLPKDVINAHEENRNMCKMEITFGSKTSGAMGATMELVFEKQNNGTTLYKSAILDLCTRIKIDVNNPETIIMPCPPLKMTYGSAKKPGDPAKKAKYMAEKDWKYGPKIWCNLKTFKTFGFNTYVFKKSQSGSIEPIEVTVTAHNICEYFRYGYETICMFKPGAVTMISENSLHKFYCSFIDVSSFYIKPTVRTVTFHHGIDASEMADMLSDETVSNFPTDNVENYGEGDSEGDNDSKQLGKPQSADDISKQLSKMTLNA